MHAEEAKVCSWTPLPEIEALLGAKASKPRRAGDAPGGSDCAQMVGKLTLSVTSPAGGPLDMTVLRDLTRRAAQRRSQRP
ncbi:MAG TPA: hypothetical protein VMT11_03590 [Myxococcaceae bacterium]|nr:hypothetical protein [Myxococcaceae bacterium]